MNNFKYVCKNKSGKYFLFIEETFNDKFLLVIPSGEVKYLERSKFGEIEEVNTPDLLNIGGLTQPQIEGYKKFVEEDSIEIFAEICRSNKDTIERFRIAKERMSMKQYEFVTKSLAESLRMHMKNNGKVI